MTMCEVHVECDIFKITRNEHNGVYFFTFYLYYSELTFLKQTGTNTISFVQIPYCLYKYHIVCITG